MTIYQPIIGLEIHVELSTKSKMFCRCSGDWQRFKPNENTCPVCLGMPGGLPVPNETAILNTIKIAQALGCHINQMSHFDRKHYYYPDLAKGYQISQYDEPIGVKGNFSVYVPTGKEFIKKTFGITRVHLEEDTGKLTHLGADSLVDFNRAGVPLVEIVTEADFRSSDDVKAFLQELHAVILSLGVSNADMENGSMRLEPNISVRAVVDESDLDRKLTPNDYPKYKVEVKNINSFNYVKKAIDFEVARHTKLLSAGSTPAQETRGYNETKGETYFQRTKENAADYRYFPDPDIPPLEFTNEQIQASNDSLPSLPISMFEDLISYKLKPQDAYLLSRNLVDFEYFKQVLSLIPPSITYSPQDVANAIINKKIPTSITPDQFISQFIELKKPKVIDVAVLQNAVSAAISANPKSVADYKSGRPNAAMFLIGVVMRELKGAASAEVVKAEILKQLS